MSSQYLCDTERPDSAHITHEVLVRNIRSKKQRVKALMDCGAAYIFISPSLLRKFGLPHEPAFTSTQGLNGEVIMSARESRKASLLVQYFKHLKPVDKSEVLVIPMKAYDLVQGLPWFKGRNPEIDWTKSPLTALRTPDGPQRGKIPEADRASPLLERGEEYTDDEPALDIQLFWLPHLVTSQIARKWSRHSPYDLENVKGSWAHLWKASPKLREIPGCWMRKQGQWR